MVSISCIICAYNEEGRIGPVLDVVSKYVRFNEVIIVDDGSVDATFAEANSFEGVKVLRSEKNLGKAGAFSLGYSASKGDLICMLDADLVGLDFTALDRLLMHHLRGEGCMSLSLRGNSLPLVKLPKIDFWSGERVFSRSLISDLDFSSVKGYGLETAINICALREGVEIYSVNWANVHYTKKRNKVGLVDGFLGEYKMVRNIMREHGVVNVTKQFVTFCRKRKIG